MKYIIVDTVADELYEREIPDQIPVGILAADLALIDAYDGYKVNGEDYLTVLPRKRVYYEENRCGVLEVDVDGSGHFYAIVFHPTRPEKAREVANKVLIRLTAAARD